MLISDAQIETLRQTRGSQQMGSGTRSTPTRPRGDCARRRQIGCMGRPTQPPALLAPSAIPEQLGLPGTGTASTQEAFGRVLVRLADLPEVRQRLVDGCARCRDLDQISRVGSIKLASSRRSRSQNTKARARC